MNQELITRNILLNGENVKEKRKEIRSYFLKTYEVYERLFDILKSDEIYYKKANPLRHPLIFYFGHTATFFINKLIIAKILDKRVNPLFESVFAIGVDEMSWDDLNEKNYNWPSVDEVRVYREKVKKVVLNLIDTLPLQLPIEWNSPFWAILMGIEHEKIHIETSSVLMRELPIKDVAPNTLFEICEDYGKAPKNELLSVSHGKVVMGKDFDSDTYGWDCEYGKKEVEVDTFKASKYLVSNEEFLEFVQNNGYEKKEFWSEEGRAWLDFKKAKYPAFWVKEGNDFKYRAIYSIIDMPWNWPVDVNFLEAEAFCNYLSKKLNSPIRVPSEEEWYRLYDYCKVLDEPEWGKKAPANINLEYFASACAVDKFKFGNFYDVIGNVWQWSLTPINGFEGFKVHPLYDDFSTPTFDNRHNLIKGGSFISCGNETLKTARYAFRRHFYQHCGFRYVESDKKIEIIEDRYEDDLELTKYIEFCYGKEYLGVKNYFTELFKYIKKVTKTAKKKKALELGTLAGRLGFELSCEYEKVHAVDFSARVIKFAVNLKQKGKLKYILKDEGDLIFFNEIYLKDFDFADNRKKVEFWQGDMANLKPNFTGYDLVAINDAMDKSYKPKKFLNEVHDRINSGGYLVISSAYDWDENTTPKNEWIGASKRDGENLFSKEALKEMLYDRFELVDDTKEIPCVVRENSRKFIYKNIEVIVWKKR